MKIQKLYLLIALFITACQAAPTAPAVTETSSPNRPIMTTTVTDRPGMFTATPTRRSFPTRTHSPTPSLEPSATIHSWQGLSADPTRYRLKEPEIIDLGGLYDYVRNETWDAEYPSPEYDLIEDDRRYFNQTILASMERRAQAESLDTQELDQSFSYFFWRDDQRMSDLLMEAVQADFSAGPEPFSDKKKLARTGYAMLPHQVEIDGDDGPEWLVQATFSQEMPVLWLAYDQLDDGAYRSLKSDLPILYPVNNNITLLTTQDLTGDRRSDAVLVDEWYAFGTYFTSFYIVRGGKEGFSRIQDYHYTTYAYDDALPYELVEGDGLPGLKLSIYQSLNWDCGWYRVITYRWPGNREQKQESGTRPPDSPECSLAKAVSLVDPVDDATALNLLLSAVGRFDTRAKDPMELAAFAHYRLALIYSRRGSDAQARQQLQAMLEVYQNNPDQEQYLTESLKPLLAEPKVNALSLCQVGYNAPFETFSLWWRYANTTNLFHSYPGGNPYPEAVCPLVSQIQKKMQSIRFNGVGSPLAAIESVGLPVFTLEKYPFGDVSFWYALLDTRPYVLIAYVKRPEGFTWQRMDIFQSNSTPLVLNQDTSGDGINEFSVAVSTPWKGACDSGNDYLLHLTGGVGDGYVASYSGEVCMPGLSSANLVEALADMDGDHLSDLLMDWVQSYNDEAFERTIERQGPLTWFTEAERAQLFASVTPQPTPAAWADPQAELLAVPGQTAPDYSRLRMQIEDLLAQIEPGDLYYDHIHARLSYLVALSYQLEGQEEEAVKRYLRLARSQPYTVWSGLAGYHLANK